MEVQSKFILSLIFLIIVVSANGLPENSGLSRTNRFLSLFNVIQFENSICNATEGNRQGLCYTSSECSQMGGRSSGVCAMGFGVCCLFEYTCQRDSKSQGQEVIYFQNEGFPELSLMPSMCLFSVTVKDDTICQIRLDFLEFELDGGSAEDRPCDRDAMEIFTGGSGNIGNNRMCGSNSGQHLYIPVDSPQTQPIIRVITDGRLGDEAFTTAQDGYTFNIKITQIDCTSDDPEMKDLRAPDGCLQYFRERRGTVNSFNWNRDSQRQYVPDQNYAICFKRSSSDCRLELRRSRNAGDFTTSVGRLVDESGNVIYSNGECGPENGCGLDDCLEFDTTNNDPTFEDYLQVTGAFLRFPTNAQDSDEYLLGSYFCGLGLGRDDDDGNELTGSDDGTGVLVTTSGPFVVVFNADNNPGILRDDLANPGENPNARNELGFSLDYRVSTSCPDLPLTKP